MTLLAGISRSLRKYLLNTESIMLICFCVVVYYYIFHGTAFWTFLERLRIKLELKVTGRYDRIPVTGDKEITSERSKASWELRKDNVGVYAIQGRRPYMEDRFNVVTDLERTKASIYGIFDGHGGEVCLIVFHFIDVELHMLQQSAFIFADYQKSLSW